jgi:uncharacterized membrane protein (DUF4010 family)
LIGVEREHSHIGREKSSGLRTFILISLFGTLSAMLAETYAAIILAAAFIGIILIICLGYIATVYLEKDIGLANEVAAIITFLLGVMCYLSEFQYLAIILAIAVTTLLATKRTTHEFAQKLKDVEVLDTLKFAVMVLIILPLLPNRNMTLYDSFALNPYEIWMMVILISAISFVGYIFIKWLGADRGIGITGILGGLASSTAVTTTMAQKVKENDLLSDACVFATIIASAVMFIRILVVVFIINSTLLPYLLIPLLAMAVTGILIAAVVWHKRTDVKTQVSLKSPLSIIPALKFGIFFAFVLLAANAANIYFGEAGIYAASMFSGLADVDAITLTLSTMSGSGLVHTKTAVIAITLAAMSNTIVKFSIAYLFGTHRFGKRVGAIFGVMIIVGAIALLII